MVAGTVSLTDAIMAVFGHGESFVWSNLSITSRRFIGSIRHGGEASMAVSMAMRVYVAQWESMSVPKVGYNTKLRTLKQCDPGSERHCTVRSIGQAYVRPVVTPA